MVWKSVEESCVLSEREADEVGDGLGQGGDVGGLRDGGSVVPLG
jgi:hypothetical protein